ncbi:MAG: phage protein [Herbinix sp.]|jgi:uncharacterized phage protein gp47/JayE|nr:phage protein [Herbinix sp.]
MFEAFTFEAILNDMLGRVTSDVDKREGSVIYDALAPAALHLADIYFILDTVFDLVSGDTAIETFLDRVVADRGVTRKAATAAVRKIVTSEPIDVGTRWAINDIAYSITELISENIYSATCEVSGEIGNTYSGALTPIDNVYGVTASITDIITAGEDTETDEELRERYFAQVRSAGTSGNKYDYRNWALDVPGCGDAKVYPLWDGPGTVKVLVIDEDMAIDPALPAIVSAYIETVRPIGAIVTVESPVSLTINITANIVLDGTRTYADVVSGFTAILTNHLKQTVFEVYSLSYAKIGSLLLSVPGVNDYNTLLVNGGTVNIAIDDTEMPIAGTITLTEVS